MEKKNMVLLTVIAIATLLVAVVGATFAYFTATIQDQRTEDEGNNGEASFQASTTAGSLTIEKSKENFGSFTATDIYPGHKELIQLKITSDANNTADTYFNIVYTGTNTFPQNAIKFHIYESLEDLTGDVTSENAFNCEKISEADTSDDGVTKSKLYETCTLNESLKITSAHEIASVTPTNYEGSNDNVNTTKTVLNGQYPFVITGTSSSRTVYYYIVAEYVNNAGAEQNSEMNDQLNGKITVEMATKNDNAIKDDDQHLSKKDGD